jgi:hypothetical protein
MLDFTKGYGYILELEKMSNKEEKVKTLEFLREKLNQLNIPLTPKDEFQNKYLNYKENWKTLVL